jgi:uncharacterized protein (TIGR00290 family)
MIAPPERAEGERRQVILSWSGGKDSSLALAALRADPSVEVVALLTSITSVYERVSIHGVRRVLVEAQALAAGLPLIELHLEPACTNAAYEASFRTAVERARERFPRLQAVAYGDLYLVDVRAYRERLHTDTELAAIFPLWGVDTRELASSFIADGFEAHVVCVDTAQLPASFAGRAYDAQLLIDLPDGVDPCGESGEFHTFVWRAPVFDRDIPVDVGEVAVREERFAYCDLQPRTTRLR